MPLELSELSLEEALRSYSSVKGHRKRVEKEIGNILRLLKNNYSATSEERINDRLEKLEKHTHKLSDIAEYLVSLKYAKARDHRKEVADFKEVLDKCSEEVFTVLHDRHATPAQAQAVQAAVQAAAPQRAPSKPSSSELRPEKLTHDASTSTFRTWKKQFKVYFDAAQMGALPCSQQQGYLYAIAWMLYYFCTIYLRRIFNRATQRHSPLKKNGLDRFAEVAAKRPRICRGGGKMSG